MSNSFVPRFRPCGLPLLVIFISIATAQADLRVIDLRCGNQVNPLAVEKAEFSWKLVSSAAGVLQTAWEVEMASSQGKLESGDADVWRSGKVVSAEQTGIVLKKIPLADATPYYWRARVWDGSDHPSAWSETAEFVTGLKGEESWRAKWVTYPVASATSLPYLRKVVSPSNPKNIQRAMVYLSALGAGKLEVNGVPIDARRVLDPAISNYNDYAFYTAFDVTKFLREGANCIGVMLGKGWFTQDQVWAPGGLPYGDPMLRLQMVIIHHDGSREVFGTDDSWLWKDGPVVNCNVYSGEIHDARREIPDWSKPEAATEGWSPVQLASNGIPPRVFAQTIDPIRAQEALKAVRITQNAAGNWIFDFGINVAANPLLQVEQPAGTKLVVSMAECLTPEGELNHSTYAPSLVGIQSDEYTCRGGGKETWMPGFTYHAFRFAELSGFVGKPDESTLQSLVTSDDVAVTGFFECSDEQINRLHVLAVRTARSNMHGIPEDCPHREKSGWLGDATAWMKMSACNFDVRNFWRKYLADIRSSAAPELKNTLFHERMNNTFYHADKAAGIPLMLSPGKRFCGVASPVWGSAIVQLPWFLYLYYGEKSALLENFDAMAQWVDHIAATARDPERTAKYNPAGDTKHIVYQGLGDWCPPGFVQDTPVEVVSTMFHFLDATTVAKAARILGKPEDAARFENLASAIRAELMERYFDPETKTFGSQAADSFALDFDMIDPADRKAVSDAITRNMNEKHHGFMNVGNQGNSRIGSALARHGNAPAAFGMFTKKGEHSYEWMWKKFDATSLWEVLPVDNRGGNSHNHPAQGGYDVFFHEDIAGIRPDASAPGYQVVRFEPRLMEHLAWAKGSIVSPYGKVLSSWKNADGRIAWEIHIPPNSSGLVALPSNRMVTVNGVAIDTARFPVGEEQGDSRFHRFPSGKYSLEIAPK